MLTVFDPQCIPASSPPSQDPNLLVHQHRGLVVSLARRRVNPFLHQDEQDLIQEGFLGLLRAARRFNPSRGTKFTTFAYRHVAGAIDRALPRLHPELPMSQLAMFNAQDTEADGEMCHDISDDGEQANAAVSVAEGHCLEAVRGFKAGLTPVQRQVVELVFWEGCAQADAARLLGISRARVSSILLHMKKRGQAELHALKA